MYEARLSSVAFTLTLLLSVLNPVARADGVCTPRDPTAVEKKSYADAYALFLRAAPKAPDGWKSTDHPATGAMPKLCREYGNPPVRRHFDRAFHLERGRQEREDKAVQANGAPQQARVMVVGDPVRVRGLLDATDLKTIAAFKDQRPSFESPAAGARTSR